MKPRQGFTLLELLIVMAIIAAMTGLLFPALAKVREAANRSVCSSNLMQFGIALHNFHDTWDHFPPAYEKKVVPGHEDVADRFYRWSALAHLLPYIDEQRIANHLDMRKPLYEADGQTVREEHRAGVSVLVRVMRCPSDPTAPPDARYGPSNYVVNVGSGRNGGDRSKGDGIFAVDRKIRLEDIPDGTSTTIMMSETLLGGGGQDINVPGGVAPMSHYAKPSSGPLTPQACNAATVWKGDRAAIWADGENVIFDHHYPPNAVDSDCVASGGYSWRAARSRHPGICNVLMADGAVRASRGAMNPKAWQALATRAGGDLVEDY